MKILFTNTGPWGTGSFITAEGIALRLIERGHQVKLFFPDSNHSCPETHKYYDNENDLYEIWQFPISDNEALIPTFPLMVPDPHPRNPQLVLYKELNDSERKLYFKECATHLRKVIDDFKPDIIETNHIWTMGHVPYTLGEKYIAVAHNSDQIAFEFDDTMRDIARSTAQHAQYILATGVLRDKLAHMYQIPQDKILVMENGYDPEIFKPIEVDKDKFFADLGLNIPHDAKIISFSGKLSKTKGVDTLLEANYYLQQADPNLHIIILGSGSLEDLIQETQDPHSLANVHIIGHQSHQIVAKVHNVARVAVMPSRTEGFGNAAIEAMGCGVPLITSDVGGPAVYAVGAVVASEAPQQLAQKILEIINLPEAEYKKLCDKAVRVAQDYTWDKVVTKREDLYNLLFESKRV